MGNYDNQESIYFDSLEKQLESLNHMNWFPSVWELDSEEVIQRQLNDEKVEKTFSKSLFEIESKSLLKSYSLVNFNSVVHDVNSDERIDSPISKDLIPEVEMTYKWFKIHNDSGKTMSLPKKLDENSNPQIFVEKENVCESNKEELKCQESEKNAWEIDFESRARFTKRHDRGKV
jgi:hypothetical protein